ncbi:hypothetical protein [Oceanirhabdus seepicola]|uniref:Uncharacterized protein n=1 Tax=Oceanirhabdus seepicola TaxID=2828781 RepID=A0A9J6NY61_9CLOT|nr:hypothetical protein [Oceanirhabdus seepicola]MCM1988988.1 hypothetical protein [Oceanirhabdus seepicola]
MVSEKLLNEFQAGENTFLFSIKTRLVWRHEQFIVLLKTMLKYCEEKCKEKESNKVEESDNVDEDDKLYESPKIMSKGFWYISWFIKEWTNHPNFRRINPKPEQYYNVAYELIHAISIWYFLEECPYMDCKDFYKELKVLEKYKY